MEQDKIASTNVVAKKRRGNPAWQKGVSGNPNGRPMGSRQKLSERFIDILSRDFDEHGEETVLRLRAEKPEVYIKVVADLVPKDVNVNMDASQAFVEMLKIVSGKK